MKQLLRFGAILTGLAFPCAALADETTNDLHCYIVSVAMVGAKDNATQMAGMLAHGYWLGRIDSLISQSELTERLVSEYAVMSDPELYRAEAIRCGQEMIDRGKAESEMGKELKARGQKMQEQNTP